MNNYFELTSLTLEIEMYKQHCSFPLNLFRYNIKNSLPPKASNEVGIKFKLFLRQGWNIPNSQLAAIFTLNQAEAAEWTFFSCFDTTRY